MVNTLLALVTWSLSFRQGRKKDTCMQRELNLRPHDCASSTLPLWSTTPYCIIQVLHVELRLELVIMDYEVGTLPPDRHSQWTLMSVFFSAKTAHLRTRFHFSCPHVGQAERALALMVDRAKQRTAFGKKLSQFGVFLRHSGLFVMQLVLTCIWFASTKFCLEATSNMIRLRLLFCH